MNSTTTVLKAARRSVTNKPSCLLLKTCPIQRGLDWAGPPQGVSCLFWERDLKRTTPRIEDYFYLPQLHPVHTRNPRFSPHLTLQEELTSSLHTSPTSNFLILRAPGKPFNRKKLGQEKWVLRIGEAEDRGWLPHPFLHAVRGAPSPVRSQVTSVAASLQA